MAQLTPEMIAKLAAPLPEEALKEHPSRSYLTVISPIYVVERLNEVFGVGQWHFFTEPIDRADNARGSNQMCVVKGTLVVPEYDIHIEQYGGNDNSDMGDAYKGAATDSLNKIASYLTIGMDIYKGLRKPGTDKPPF